MLTASIIALIVATWTAAAICGAKVGIDAC